MPTRDRRLRGLLKAEAVRPVPVTLTAAGQLPLSTGHSEGPRGQGAYAWLLWCRKSSRASAACS